MRFNNTNQPRKPGDGYFIGTSFLYFIPPKGPGPQGIDVSLEEKLGSSENIPVWFWDGNAAKPTLTPSLDVQDEDGNSCWHGFLQNGIFVGIDGLPVESETEESEMHDADGNVIDEGADSAVGDGRELFEKTLEECPVMKTFHDAYMDATSYFGNRDHSDYDHGVFTEKMFHVRDAVERVMKEYGA